MYFKKDNGGDDVDGANIESMIHTFESFINNPISKRTINAATAYCNKCGTNRLECALDFYLGKREDICLKCRLVLPALKMIIKGGLNKFQYF